MAVLYPVHPDHALTQHAVAQAQLRAQAQVLAQAQVQVLARAQVPAQAQAQARPQIQNAQPRVGHASMKQQAANLASIPTNIFLKMILFLVDLRCTKGHLGG